MNDVLKRILAEKQNEVLALKESFVIHAHTERQVKSLRNALLGNKSIIAEIKRASPAKGKLSDILDPVALAKQYQSAGAAAISVLTDKQFFSGSVDDLLQVSIALSDAPCPLLRKDFIIDPIQIHQAYAYGADAILLIVAAVKDKTQALIDDAHRLGLEVLLEVHTADELMFAINTTADVIGVNNRNLNTLEVDIKTSLDLITLVPRTQVCVSESGIHDAMTASILFDAGFNGLLVGEALVRSSNPGELLKAMRGQ